MRIIYDDKVHLYGVCLEPPDTVMWLNTSDIAEARTMYVERLTKLFNEAVCEQLKD